MTMENSMLYKQINFLAKYGSPSFSVMNVFYFILGYQLGSAEEWIPEFIEFVEIKLLKKYYHNNLSNLPRNYGEVIYENQLNDAEGLSEFLELLEEYKSLISMGKGSWK